MGRLGVEFGRLAAGMVALCLAPSLACAADSPTLLGVRFGGDGLGTRVVIDISGRPSANLAQGARRLDIALNATPGAIASGGSGRGVVAGWSLVGDGPGEAIELSLKSSAHIVRRFAIPPGQGADYWRYVIDLAPGGDELATELSGSTSQNAIPNNTLLPLQEKVASVRRSDEGSTESLRSSPLRNHASLRGRRDPSSGPLRGPPSPAKGEGSIETANFEQNPAPPEHTNAKTASRAPHVSRKVVVIDAGHGGHDSGALGAKHEEKELTLAAALALKDRLERSGRYKVILTRDSDVFIPLADRVKIARKGGVDLFLSLHADSAGGDAATHGASVYTLSDSGVGRAHYVIGRNEWFTKVATRSGDSGVSQILLDLSQRSTRNHSSAFADLLLDKLQSKGVDLLPRSHRDAGYFVLLAPDVPAALLEMGFVTNLEDEARLSESRARGRMVDAVAQAIDAYFDLNHRSPGSGAVGPKV